MEVQGGGFFEVVHLGDRGHLVGNHLFADRLFLVAQFVLGILVGSVGKVHHVKGVVVIACNYGI